MRVRAYADRSHAVLREIRYVRRPGLPVPEICEIGEINEMKDICWLIAGFVVLVLFAMCIVNSRNACMVMR